MNKIVPSIMAISAILFTAGCASSGVKGNSYNGMAAHNGAYANHANRAYQNNAGGSYSAQGGQYQQVSCQTCGQGSHAVNHGHSRSATGQTVTHTHAGNTGHAHNGMSGSHSYQTTTATAGRNGGAYAANNGGYAVNNGYANTAARGAGYANAGGGIGSTAVKVAGALLVGGLIYKVVKDNDDDDDNNNSVSTPATEEGK